MTTTSNTDTTEAAALYAEVIRLKAIVDAGANKIISEDCCRAEVDLGIAGRKCRKAFAALKAAGMTVAEIQTAVGA